MNHNIRNNHTAKEKSMRPARTIHVAILIFAFFITPLVAATPKVGDKLPVLKLAGEAGGRVDGSEWSSELISGKVWALFYVDPDEKGLNVKMEEALKAADFPASQYGSTAVINMDASWLPNAAIASALADKQKEFPQVVYAKDMKKALVKQWGLKDDDYGVLVFDKTGTLLYIKEGLLLAEDIRQLVATIKKAISE